VPVFYTGFVVPGTARPVGPRRTRRLIVSAGGGRAGGPLFRAAVEAHAILWRRERLRMTVVAGPFLPEADWRPLRRAAREVAGLELRRSVPNLGERLLDAAASVSQCGYNTALDIVCARVPALVMPCSELGKDEQWVRARRLAARPLRGAGAGRAGAAPRRPADGGRGGPARRGRAQPPLARRAGGRGLRAARDLRPRAPPPLPGLPGRPRARRARPGGGRRRDGAGARGGARGGHGARAGG